MLSLLAHLLFFLAIWFVRLPSPIQIAQVTPVMSYLYQPLPVVLPEPLPVEDEVTENTADKSHSDSLLSDQVTAIKDVSVSAADNPMPHTEAAAVAESPVAIAAEQKTGSIAERALYRALSADIDMAGDSYQQFRKQQREPGITTDKRHHALSVDPQQQVLMKLDNGMHIIRTKDGCRLADPSKDGFDGLMAVHQVPCGDETTTAELLKQSLEKHIRR